MDPDLARKPPDRPREPFFTKEKKRWRPREKKMGKSEANLVKKFTFHL